MHAFGVPRDEALTSSYADLDALGSANATLQTLGVDLSIVDGCAGTHLVHSHTWYANLAGHLSSLLYDVPHVVTAHSLEPLRPWKAEQLGGGYAVSSWVERTSYLAASAVIAVSAAMRDDVLASYPRSIPSGSRSSTTASTPRSGRRSRSGPGPRARCRPPGPRVVFVGGSPGRRAFRCSSERVAQLPADVQIVLCAGAPDTPEIEAEVVSLVSRSRRREPAWCGSWRCCRGTKSSSC